MYKVYYTECPAQGNTTQLGMLIYISIAGYCTSPQTDLSYAVISLLFEAYYSLSYYFGILEENLSIVFKSNHKYKERKRNEYLP